MTIVGKPVARWKKRLLGAFILLLSGGLNAWNWHCALTKGYFSQKPAVILPALAVIGLGVIIFPGDTEVIVPENISRLQAIKLMPLRWWIILVAGLALGGVNYWLLSR
jgi:hypothetical protein